MTEEELNLRRELNAKYAREQYRSGKKKRTYTDEQRERNAARLREYRKAHPDRVRAWRDAYILRKAERIKNNEIGGKAE